MRLTARQYAEGLLGALAASDARDHEGILTRFAVLLRARRATKLFGAIRRAFDRLADVAQGKTTVTATTAEPLDGESQAHLNAAIARALDRPVAVRFQHDPQLLAGAVFQIGDERIDASAHGLLQGLRSTLRR